MGDVFKALTIAYGLGAIAAAQVVQNFPAETSDQKRAAFGLVTVWPLAAIAAVSDTAQTIQTNREESDR